MIKHVYYQVMVYIAMVGYIHAWPVMPGKHILREELTNEDIALNCGEHKKLNIDHTKMITLTAGDIVANNLYIANCTVTIRVGLKSSATQLEKYGIAVDGSISFRDGSATCTNSFISVADEDSLDDEMGSLEKYCGGPNKKFTFTTTEDYINIEVNIGSSIRATRGNGFTITIMPHFICGGVIDTDTTLETPYHPKPYPRDMSCFWEVKAPTGYDITLNCSQFDFPRANKAGKCSDDLMINHNNDVDIYCGNSLLNKQKKFYNTTSVLLAFRSDPTNNKYPGFHCNLKFNMPEKTKNMFLARFYK